LGGVIVADKMWDILRFLKDPEGENLKDLSSNSSAEAEKRQINEQLAGALERAAMAIDKVLSKQESDEFSVGADESDFLTQDLGAPGAYGAAEDGVSGSPDTADTPEIPETPETPETAEITEVPETPEEAEAPVQAEGDDQALEAAWNAGDLGAEEDSLPDAAVAAEPAGREHSADASPEPDTLPEPGISLKADIPPESDVLPEPVVTPAPVITPKPVVPPAPVVLPEPDEAAGPEGGRLLEIAISSVRPNPFQPRKVMGDTELRELSQSIKEFGVLQPILVKSVPGGYELIAGERRLRAASLAGLSEIPAMVVETEPVTQQIIALVENIQRKNLSAIEEAVCLNDILSKTGWSQTELSSRMGRSQASIANKLRLLRLDASVQELVISGKLGERQARSLLSLSTEEQRQLAQRAIDEELSARALEQLVENWNNRERAPRSKARKNSPDGPACELLGDIASIVNRHKGRGISAQWKVKQMNQDSMVVEITVDLTGGGAGETGGTGEAVE
jgi:ParB family chromosome partitioning protein